MLDHVRVCTLFFIFKLFNFCYFSIIVPRREAMSRGATVFLPEATYPMFPEKLAMEEMSLKQGENCNAMTVSVLLHSDGR
jgi:RNB domain-containing protein